MNQINPSSLDVFYTEILSHKADTFYVGGRPQWADRLRKSAVLMQKLGAERGERHMTRKHHVSPLLPKVKECAQSESHGSS